MNFFQELSFLVGNWWFIVGKDDSNFSVLPLCSHYSAITRCALLPKVTSVHRKNLWALVKPILIRWIIIRIIYMYYYLTLCDNQTEHFLYRRMEINIEVWWKCLCYAHIEALTVTFTFCFHALSIGNVIGPNKGDLHTRCIRYVNIYMFASDIYYCYYLCHVEWSKCLVYLSRFYCTT